MFGLGGCSGSGAVPAEVQAAPSALRIASAASPGRGDDLAAELLLVSGAVDTGPLRPAQRVAGVDLARSLEAMALAHLRAQALGVGSGPDLAGSLRIRRLALAPQAPPDLNGDGRNWEETLLAEAARVAAFAGAAPPMGLRQSLFPWVDASSALQNPLDPVADPPPSQWRTQRRGGDLVRLVDIGGAMRARVLAGGRLLGEARGTEVGATSEEGALGLLLIEQLLAIEEQLLGAMFSNGGPLGPLGDITTYDPAIAPRWLPREFEVLLDATGELPMSFRVTDGASDLTALASVLEAVADLIWFSGPENPAATVQKVFTVVFPPPEPKEPPPPVLSWSVEVGPLMMFRCSGCHFGFATGGFSINSYASVLAGSPRTQTLGLPMVVPGNHQASMLHTILVGPPPPFLQMPPSLPGVPGGSMLPAPEIQLIADWIDQGALEDPPLPPPPPLPGEDLARVLFRNLVALHFEPETGALHHRFEADGGSGVALATSTGRALVALRRLAAAMPGLEYDSMTPASLLDSAAKFAALHMLDAEGRAVSDLDFANDREGPAAALRAQAALTAGLLAAAEGNEQWLFDAAGSTAAATLIEAFRSPQGGLLLPSEDHSFGRFTPAVLVDVLSALRSAAAHEVAGAGMMLSDMLEELRPLLAHSEWNDDGEVLGDGIADTDDDGVPEPAAAGGDGRMPLLVGAILAGDPADSAPPDPRMSWSRHVRPLLADKCGSCHFGGNVQGDYTLDTVRAAGRPGVSGGILPLIVPGDAQQSLLYRKLVDRLPPIGAQMPMLDTPLDERAREMVRVWIEQGATKR